MLSLKYLHFVGFLTSVISFISFVRVVQFHNLCKIGTFCYRYFTLFLACYSSSGNCYWRRTRKRKNSDTVDDCFVHREAIHCDDDNKYVLSGDHEKIFPDPDTSDNLPMYLKRPHKHPKRMFAPHNKNLTMPENLRLRYEKNDIKIRTAATIKKSNKKELQYRPFGIVSW